jgi:hypothetical protein
MGSELAPLASKEPLAFQETEQGLNNVGNDTVGSENKSRSPTRRNQTSSRKLARNWQEANFFVTMHTVLFVSASPKTDLPERGYKLELLIGT